MKLWIVLSALISSNTFAISGDIAKHYEIEKQLHQIQGKNREPGSLSTSVKENHKRFEWKQAKDGKWPKSYNRGKLKKNKQENQ